MPECRRAGPQDLETLVAMVREFCVVDDHPFHEPKVRNALGPLLETEDQGLVLVVEDDGVVAGYAVLTWGYSLESGGRDALLDEIFTTEHNRGHGSRLLEAALAHARRHGAARMFLETEARNAAVRRLYARFGFEEEDSVWMSRDLDSPDQVEPD